MVYLDFFLSSLSWSCISWNWILFTHDFNQVVQFIFQPCVLIFGVDTLSLASFSLVSFIARFFFRFSFSIFFTSIVLVLRRLVRIKLLGFSMTFFAYSSARSSASFLFLSFKELISFCFSANFFFNIGSVFSSSITSLLVFLLKRILLLEYFLYCLHCLWFVHQLNFHNWFFFL